ncbi:MAG: DUF5700 domain-containing putative Zn-dependent protease [Pyrinomonadaceae bacterium]
MIRKIAILLAVIFIFPAENSSLAGLSKRSEVNVKMMTDQADAVLSILEKRARKQTVSEPDWKRLFESEGYLRLKKREHSLGRRFEDSEFRLFVTSEELLSKRTRLRETVAKWKTADVRKTASMALEYLPENAAISAKIYPVIKPRSNSFVFEIKTDPAIFLYVDPEVELPKFENTLTHELHHIGFGSACPDKETAKQIESLPKDSQNVLKWLGAFSEGFAMLAAAGGPEVDPHKFSAEEDRKRWEKDVSNFNNDLKDVEDFLIDLSEGKLDQDAEIDKARSFYGIQGPWYTVGWKMSAVIEKSLGRKELIKCMCSNQLLLSTFNKAAGKYNKESGEELRLWTDSLIEKLR